MGKKQKSRQARKKRMFESEAGRLPALRLSAEPASQGTFGEEQAAAPHASSFSPETIQHLIERIKSI